MVRAFVIDFIAELRKRYTVLTLLVRLMFALAFGFDLREICFKALMLDKLFIFITCDTIGTFLKRAMITQMFDLLDIVFSNSETIKTLSIGSMIAVTLFDLLFRYRFMLRMILSQLGCT